MSENTKLKFQVAKLFIEEGHTETASLILTTIKHPTAQKMLNQIGYSKRRGRLNSTLTNIFLVILLISSSFYLGRVSAPLDLADQVRNELLNSLNTDPSAVDPLQSTDDVSAQATQTAIAIINDALRTQAAATQNSISPELAATATAAASGKVAP